MVTCSRRRKVEKIRASAIAYLAGPHSSNAFSTLGVVIQANQANELDLILAERTTLLEQSNCQVLHLMRNNQRH